jgi:hypothetical protein
LFTWTPDRLEMDPNETLFGRIGSHVGHLRHLSPLPTVVAARLGTRPGTRMSVANGSPGVNTNALSARTFVDEPSGNGALNGIP